jgi:hypothetical protein
MDLAPLFVVLLGSAFAVVACGGLSAREKRFAMSAFGIHVLASFVHWALVEFYYGYSDGQSYVEQGAAIARLLEADVGRFGPEVVKMALHLDNVVPVDVASNSSGTMTTIAGVLVYLVGPSFLAAALVSTCISWAGQLCLYRIAREELPVDDRTVALVSFLYIPSVIFWGAGYDKEALILGLFGLLALATYRVGRNRNFFYIPGIIVSAIGVSLIKPYTLFPFILAAAAFLYADRAWRHGGPIRIRPAYLVLAAALSVGGIAAMGRLFPQYAADRVAESLATTQQAWEQVRVGGTDIDVGSGDAKTLAEQLRFVPVAVVNAFFRPAIFEARSAPAIGAAIETTLLALGVFTLFLPRRFKIVREAVLRTPLLVFSAVFVSVFAVAVGLATSNLGSLSRYRTPMMPFYVLTLLVARRRIAADESRVMRAAAAWIRSGHSRTA